MNHVAVVTGVVVCLAATVVGQETAALQQAVEASRADLKATGIAVAVIRRDGELWQGVAGKRELDEPMTPAAVFQIGSITKTYTAALMLRLVETEKLRLDATIGRWYPDLPNAERITIRQILNHTSGLNDIFQQEGFSRGLYFNPGKRWQVAELLEKTGPADFEPGQGWAYSSTGYLALAGIAEQRGKGTFAQQLREEFFQPLGLRRTYVGGMDEIPEPIVHAMIDINGDQIEEDLSAMLPMTGILTASGGAGGIVATPGDVATWLRALMQGKVVDVKQMTTWVKRTDGNQHGLGLLRIEIDGTELIGHRGNSGGFSCAAWHAPEHDLTLVVCTNRNGILVTPAVTRILKALEMK